MWHCEKTSFCDWLVWINQLMRNHSSNDQNMLTYSTAILDQVNLFLRTLMRILRFLRTLMRILRFLRNTPQKKGNRGAPPYYSLCPSAELFMFLFRAIVLLIKPFVWYCSRCCRRRGLLKLPNIYSLLYSRWWENSLSHRSHLNSLTPVCLTPCLLR